MSGSWGRNIRISIFGESHGAAVGIVLDGIEPGFKLDMEKIKQQIRRRSPGLDELSSPRKEQDQFELLSGIYNGTTTGTPIGILIRNIDQRSEDYEKAGLIFRPSHADHTGWVKYKGFNDPRGGGHFSGRLTAAVVCAGAIAMQLLEKEDIHIGSHILKAGSVESVSTLDDPLSMEELSELKTSDFPVRDEAIRDSMVDEIISAKAGGDSLGGVVEVIALRLSSGIGDPFFDSVESVLSGLFFSIPAVKGVEFGIGFKFPGMKGSEANDQLRMEGGRIVYSSNNNGGILGGITNGMPLVARLAIKPTPSIALPQRTVSFDTGTDKEIALAGRHDPAIIRRIAPVAEAAAALGILDILMESRKWD
jgi:chorismate synthase